MPKKHRRNNGNGVDNQEIKDTSLFVPQRDKIKENLNIREFNWTDNQKVIIDTILNKNSKLIFINGCAGTGKTIISAYCGLKLLNDKKVSEILYVRNIIESATKSIGALPGLLSEKIHPFLMPLEDKLQELLQKNQINKLRDDKRIDATVINFLRGANFNAKFVLADEVQNFSKKEIITLITRIGKFSKMILCADIRQSDINGRSGFKDIFDLFNNEESRANGIYSFELGTKDIMRSGIVKFILEKLDNPPREPMFDNTGIKKV